MKPIFIRKYRAAVDEMRCTADVTLRGDDSPGRCMRARKVGGLCLQHAYAGHAKDCGIKFYDERTGEVFPCDCGKFEGKDEGKW